MTVKTEIADGVAIITIDRPNQKNAMNKAVGTALVEAIQMAGRSEQVQVVLLTGHEEFFCTGADLSEVVAEPPSRKNAGALAVFNALISLEKPIICCVSGLAIGAGATIPFLCDVVYASDNVRFSYPFTDLGLCPEAGSSMTLVTLLGYQKAAELLLFGDTIDAKLADSLGMVSKVFDTSVALDQSLKRCRILAQKAPSSLLAVKSLMRAPYIEQLKQQIDREFSLLEKMFVGPDAKEAFTALAERRKAVFV